LQYIESIVINGVGVAFVIPHYSSKTCILAAITMTSHLLGYTSISIKAQLLCYTLLAASFRILNLQNPYVLLETVGSKLVFGSSPLAVEAKPDQTKSVEADKKVKCPPRPPF
jgi:hypothetical protein